MDKNIINELDTLLLLLSTKYLGVVVVSSQLLREIGYETITYKSLFLIDIIIADGYATKHDLPNQTPVISISPLGFRFFNAGGYANYHKNNLEDLTQNQTKMKLEIRDLQWGFWIGLASLLLSIIAIIISLLL